MGYFMQVKDRKHVSNYICISLCVKILTFYGINCVDNISWDLA